MFCDAMNYFVTLWKEEWSENLQKGYSTRRTVNYLSESEQRLWSVEENNRRLENMEKKQYEDKSVQQITEQEEIDRNNLSTV